MFEKTGTFKFQFGIPGKEEGQLWYPRKVAVMRNSGKFVVCDRGNERSRMQIFTKNGHFIKKIAIRWVVTVVTVVTVVMVVTVVTVVMVNLLICFNLLLIAGISTLWQDLQSPLKVILWLLTVYRQLYLLYQKVVTCCVGLTVAIICENPLILQLVVSSLV